MPRRRKRIEDRRESIPGITYPTDAVMAQYRRSLEAYDRLPEGARLAIQEFGDEAIRVIDMGHKEYDTIVMVINQIRVRNVRRSF